jgi:hypothetical protein
LAQHFSFFAQRAPQLFTVVRRCPQMKFDDGRNNRIRRLSPLDMLQNHQITVMSIDA